MNKIGEMVFKDLPTTIIMAESIAPKYLKEGQTLPHKYDNHYYDFIEGYLCDLQNNERVIINAKEVGQQRVIAIAGQRLHELLYSSSAVAKSKVDKIKKKLKEYFLSNMTKIHIANYPVHVEFKFYINDGNRLQDLDNLSIMYEKIFFDCIQTELFESGMKKKGTKRKKIVNLKGIIANDSIDYISGISKKVFFTKTSPYLIVNFYEYTSLDEHDKDKANLKLDKTLIDSVERLATLFATLSLENKRKSIEELHKDDELADMLNTFWQKEYDFYFETLTNEFLR